jgi:hypothetical protein
MTVTVLTLMVAASELLSPTGPVQRFSPSLMTRHRRWAGLTPIVVEELPRSRGGFFMRRQPLASWASGPP